MITELAKQLSFKYAVWIMVAIVSVTVGYWYGVLHTLGIDTSVLELSTSSASTAVLKCWVLLFHLVFTFVALRDSDAADNLLDQANTSVDNASKQLAALGVEGMELGAFLKHHASGNISFGSPPEAEGDKQAHFKALLSDLEQASAPLTNPRIQVAGDVPKEALDQAATLIRGAMPALKSGALVEVLNSIEESSAAGRAFDEATRQTKAQKALARIIHEGAA